MYARCTLIGRRHAAPRFLGLGFSWRDTDPGWWPTVLSFNCDDAELSTVFGLTEESRVRQLSSVERRGRHWAVAILCFLPLFGNGFATCVLPVWRG
jgi:hypothetical protein